MEEMFEWRSPQELRQLVDEQSLKLGTSAMHGAGKDWREAFTASTFASGRADLVRLLQPVGHTPTPDFATWHHGVERWFESVETDRPGRRRGLEYPAGEAASTELQHVPEEDWVDPDQYFELVSENVGRKARKAYPRCDGLLINNNAFPIARSFELTTAWWRKATEAAANRFPAVYVRLNEWWAPVWIGGAAVAIEMVEPRSIDGIGDMFAR